MVFMFQKVLVFLLIGKCLSNYTSWSTGDNLNMYAIGTKGGSFLRRRGQTTPHCHIPRSLKEFLSSKQRKII